MEKKDKDEKARFISEEIACAICREELKDTFSCGHTVHPWCGVPHSDGAIKCPMCEPKKTYHQATQTEPKIISTKSTVTQTEIVQQSLLVACCSLIKPDTSDCYWYPDYLKDNIRGLGEWRRPDGRVTLYELMDCCCMRHTGAFLFSDHGIICPRCCLDKTPCWDELHKTWCGCSDDVRNGCRIVFPALLLPLCFGFHNGCLMALPILCVENIVCGALRDEKYGCKCEGECPYWWPSKFERPRSLRKN